MQIDSDDHSYNIEDVVVHNSAAGSLLCYCLGLFAYAGIKLVVSGFYSLQDTKTPVKIGALCMILNIVFNIVLMQFLKEAGLALATALSSTINFILLVLLLRKKIGPFGELKVVASFLRIIGISVAMGICTQVIFVTLHLDLFSSCALNLLVRLIVTIFLSGVIYIILGLMCRVHEMQKIVHTCLTYFRKKPE